MTRALSFLTAVSLAGVVFAAPKPRVRGYDRPGVRADHGNGDQTGRRPQGMRRPDINRRRHERQP